MKPLGCLLTGLGLMGCLDFGPPISVDIDANVTPDAARMADTGPLDGALIDSDLPDAGIEALSTEFDDADSIAGWRTFNPASFRSLDVGETHAGSLTMHPALGGWHEARTAGFMYVEIDGDFIIEADMIAGQAGDLGAGPTELFNVGGVMAREPDVGSENWVLLGIGYLSEWPGVEGKSTQGNQSTQTRLNVDANAATLRICRVGPAVYLMFQLAPDAAWQSAWRESGLVERVGLADRLQVGLFVNGWNSSGGTPATMGTPDLEAVFSAVRFRRPAGVADCVE